MNLFNLSETVKLSLQLDDGVVTKYPRAFVYQNGTLETTIDLTHIAQGRYSGNWIPILPTQYSIVYVVFKDSSHTVIDSDYSRELDFWRAVDSFIDSNWNELLSGHTIPGSTGEALSRIPITPASARERVVQGYAFVANQNNLIGNLWLERDGQLVTNVVSCNVGFYSDQGALLFSMTDLTPDSQSVFRVNKPNPGFVGDQLVYAVGSIVTSDPKTITTVKTISTVS